MPATDNSTTAVSSSIVLDYTSRDFDSIRSLLVGIGRGTFPEWITLGEAGDFGTLLVDLYAFMGDISNYYIDRVGAEAFLGTAALRRSLLYIADMLGYKPIGQQAAVVTLTFTLDADAPPCPTIPAGTVVSTTADADIQATFELDSDISLNPGDTKTVTASEGATTTELITTSRGVPNMDTTLSNKGVVFNSLTITSVEGFQTVTWDHLDNLINARPTQSAYSTYVDDGGTTHVIFGDNTAGRIPPTGVSLTATYRYGTGAAPNSIPAGSINTLVGMSQPTGLTFQNLDTPLGGADIESADSMRFSIPRSQSVANRAVTIDDYVALTVKVPGVGKAMAYGQVYSNVTVRIAPVGGAAAVDSGQMSTLRDSVSDYLSDKVMIGSTVYVEDVYGGPTTDDNRGWEDITLDFDLYVLPGYNRTEITNQVTDALADALAFDQVDFGYKVSIGYIYRTILSIEGVDYAVIKTLTSENSTDPSAVTNIDPMPDRIPRIRAEITDDSNNIIQEYGLTVTSFGGLV